MGYPYLTFIGYDKFEARERVVLGNGTATNYSYNPLNRRLTGLLAQTKSARTFMNMSYGYDAVGNIKTLANSAAVPTAITKGGATSYSFGYDDLYQLTSATGAFAKPSQATQKFTLSMAYDGIHNITHKTQTAFNLLSNGSTTPNVALTYDYPYAYAGGRPHAASQVGNHAFLYDLDGNQAGWNATDSYQNRRMVWDEDGRLQSVTDNNGQPTTFKYDGDTNRVVKKGAGGETLYINPWYVAALGRNSKQIFAGGTRIATKLEISPTGEGYGPGAKNLKEVAQYFYHQDHLGSTGFATDATGEVYQHLEYFPFGETWVDEVSDDTRVPYRFTGQELDQETKLYYYGARYYDPRTSAWQNPEPALGAFLNAGKPLHFLPSLATGWRSHLASAGMGGAFEPMNLNGFGYAHQNPLRVTDPDGRVVIADDVLIATGVVVVGGTIWVMSSPERKRQLEGALSRGLENAQNNLQDWGKWIVSPMTQSGEGGKEAKPAEDKPTEGEAKPDAGEIKIDDKVKGQLGPRGWTEQEIKDIVKTPPAGTSEDKRSPGKTSDNAGRDDTATVYGSKDKGHVVVNDRTKEVVHVSDKTDQNWIPDLRIKWNGE